MSIVLQQLDECQGVLYGSAGCALLHRPGLQGSWTWPAALSTQFFGVGARSDWASISDVSSLAAFVTSTSFCGEADISLCPSNGGWPHRPIDSGSYTGDDCLLSTPTGNCVFLRGVSQSVPATQIFSVAKSNQLVGGDRVVYAVNLEGDFNDVGPRFASADTVAAATAACPGIAEIANLGTQVNSLYRCRRACLLHRKIATGASCSGILFSSQEQDNGLGCTLLTAPTLGVGVPSCSTSTFSGTSALQLLRTTSQPLFSIVVSSANYEPVGGMLGAEVVWEWPAFHVDLFAGHALHGACLSRPPLLNTTA